MSVYEDDPWIACSISRPLARELLEALESSPRRELLFGTLVDENTDDQVSVCALGELCFRRGFDPRLITDTKSYSVAKTIRISPDEALNITTENDRFMDESNAERWARMRKWAEKCALGKSQ